jgi:hypothetical protein
MLFSLNFSGAEMETDTSANEETYVDKEVRGIDDSGMTVGCNVS